MIRDDLGDLRRCDVVEGRKPPRQAQDGAGATEAEAAAEAYEPETMLRAAAFATFHGDSVRLGSTKVPIP